MSVKDIFPNNDLNMSKVLWANGIYNRQDIQWYKKFNRFGALDPYNALSGHKEYLFFTKPDLHIVKAYSDELNPELANQPFFVELRQRYPGVISQLQQSSALGNKGPFMTILSNALKNTLELPSITTSEVDTPATIYGTAYNYRGWGFKDDENVEFSLEIEDSKYLEIYHLVKAYEEYERLKRLGIVTPPNIKADPVTSSGKCFNYYTKNKILHDQFSVYKFIVEDDAETIVYYAKFWGVFFKNVPRDAFSDLKNEGGLTYRIDFKAAFVDDMNPSILTDFNRIVTDREIGNPNLIGQTIDLPVYDQQRGMIDGRWATSPYIIRSYKKDNLKTWAGPNDMNYTYKLKWRL